MGDGECPEEGEEDTDEGERLGGDKKVDMYDSSPGDLNLPVPPKEEVVVVDELEVEREAMEWLRWRIFLRRSPPSPTCTQSGSWPEPCLALVEEERLVYLVLARCMTVLSRWAWGIKPWCTTETWTVDQGKARVNSFGSQAWDLIEAFPRSLRLLVFVVQYGRDPDGPRVWALHQQYTLR